MLSPSGWKPIKSLPTVASAVSHRKAIPPKSSKTNEQKKATDTVLEQATLICKDWAEKAA